MDLTELTECLACGHKDLKSVLDLNDQPLANSYKNNKDDPEESYPLKINMCLNCHHVQLTHVVNPDLIYKNYLYVSGTTKTYVEYMDWYAKFVYEKYTAQQQGTLGPYSVLDIGCNDGSQLNAFKKLMAFTTYGVDPAENLYELSSKNHNVKCGYFDETYTQKVDIVTIQNAFAHNPNPLKLLQNAKAILKRDGLIFIQTSQADMILNNEFDTIYHEHISFYNIKSMQKLCQRAGLNLVDVVKTPIHGVSYIFIISANKSANSTVENLIAMEEIKGLYSNSTYDKYADKCLDDVNTVSLLVDYWKEAGFKIVGYGAPAKGNTFLNFSKVKLDMIIDDNPMKQGMYTPGSSIGIVGPEVLKTFKEDDKIFFIPLAWNFFDEIRKRILAQRDNPNDKFLNMKDL